MYYVISFQLPDPDRYRTLREEIDTTLTSLTSHVEHPTRSTWILKSTGNQLQPIYRRLDRLLDPAEHVLVAEVRERNLHTDGDLP